MDQKNIMEIYFYKNDIPNDLIFSKSIAIDTETMGLKTYRDRLCLIQISQGDGKAHIIQIVNSNNKNKSHNNLINLLKNKNIEKIFHYARFDLAALKHYFGMVDGPIWCTKIASKLARTYTDRHGLSDICKELLSVEISKQQQSSNWGSKNLSTEQKQYAASDVIYLHQLKKELTMILEQEERLNLAKDVFKFLQTRVDLDLKGFESLDIFSH